MKKDLFFPQNQRAYTLALISAGIPLLPLVFDGFNSSALKPQFSFTKVW